MPTQNELLDRLSYGRGVKFDEQGLLAPDPAPQPSLAPAVTFQGIVIDDDVLEMTGCLEGEDPPWALVLANLVRVFADPYWVMKQMTIDPALFKRICGEGEALREVGMESITSETMAEMLAYELRRRM